MSELAREIDPENRLLWKFNRRRLQAEEVRDAILAVSGTLNSEMFGESVITPVEEGMVQLLYDQTNGRLPRTNVSTIVGPCT